MLKYVIIEQKTIISNQPKVIIFDPDISHSDMYSSYGKGKKILGAGFVHQLPDGEIRCWGMSRSLNVYSTPNDTKIVQEKLAKGT